MGGYKTIQVTGSDPTGRYVAGRANPVADMRSTVVVWHDNRIARIVKKDRLELTDFTTKGVGVGYEVDGTRAYVYTDGTLTPLKGDRLTADAINEAGVIVGTSAVRPVRWASATADPEPLPLPAGTAQGVVSGLAEDGTIVGRVDLDIGYLWLPDGTHRPIAAPEIDGVPARGFVPVELRNGWIYGDAMVPVDTGGIEATAMRPFRYQLATGRYERLAKQDGTPSFYLGSWLVPLPGDPSVSGRTSYAVTAVSDDNRALAGDSNASSGGAFLPVSWRCEEE
nr:hypothetical protein GCM10020092_049330 [Actinoplanes digitatis]